MTTTPTPVPAILCIRSFSAGYPGGETVLHDWSADIGPGATLLYGDTGSGKTLLLKALAGELPASGSASIDGISLERDPAAFRAQVFHADPKSPSWDELQPAEAAARMAEGGAGHDAAQWQRIALALGLAPHLDKKMFMLSTGSRRKVWLAAALASQRRVTLLDEPTAALDLPSMRAFWSELAAAANDARRAIVVASYEHPAGAQLAATLELPPPR